MDYLKKTFSVPYMGKSYSDGWERMFGKKEPIEPMCEYAGSKMKIKMIYHGYGTHSFSVELVEGEWPSDNDLITLCDGDIPPNEHHFGGSVRKSMDGITATVEVYVD